MTISADIPETLQERLTELARTRSTSVDALVVEAVENFLRTQPQATPSKQCVAFPVYGDPTERMTPDELRRRIEEADLEDDLKKLGLVSDDSDRR